jgi:large subunit ribosomal protein L7/L12
LLNNSGDSKKIQIIKVLREVTGMGLKETKEVVDQVEWSESSTVILNEVEAEVAFKVKKELEAFGLKPEVERT